MKTIRTKVYQFSELSKEAKETVIRNLSDINFDVPSWYEPTFEDAKNIGLELGEFDTDSASFVRNLSGEFSLTAHEVAANIIRDHGDQCDTYKTAQSFLDAVNEIQGKYEELEGQNYEDEMIQVEENLLAELLIDYTNMLQNDIEYLGSRPAIIETIEANEYDFTKDGKLFHS
jgi:hypothetical protein